MKFLFKVLFYLLVSASIIIAGYIIHVIYAVLLHVEYDLELLVIAIMALSVLVLFDTALYDSLRKVEVLKK